MERERESERERERARCDERTGLPFWGNWRHLGSPGVFSLVALASRLEPKCRRMCSSCTVHELSRYYAKVCHSQQWQNPIRVIYLLELIVHSITTYLIYTNI